jgi:hypothetical protein
MPETLFPLCFFLPVYCTDRAVLQAAHAVLAFVVENGRAFFHCYIIGRADFLAYRAACARGRGSKKPVAVFAG